jgi:outer membrane protein assembly factor BamB
MKKLVLLFASMTLLAACSDAKKEDLPAELMDIESTLKVKREWTYSFGGGSERLRLALSPRVDDGKVYAAGFDGEVVALKMDNGRRVWDTDTDLELTAGPGVGEGLVVVGSNKGILVALDAATGDEKWRKQLSSEVLATPVISHELVVVRTLDGRVVALSKDGAEVRWSVEQAVPKLSLRGTAPPVVAGDAVITAFDNGRVMAVEMRTGDTQWDTAVGTPSGRSELDRLVDIDAPVRVIDDDVFVVGFHGRVAMLARDSGQIWWARDFSSYRGLAVHGQSLYASNDEGTVVSMRRTDGSVNWEQAALRLRALTTPVVDGQVLVIGDYEGYLHWLSTADGTFLARVKTDGERITNAPIAINGFVFVQTDGGSLIAFRASQKS